MNGPRIPRQRRARAKVEAITRAAVHILAIEGYEAATMRHVADRAGVSVGTIYAYFANRDAIYAAFVKARVDDVFAAVLGPGAPRNLDSFEALVRLGAQATADFRARNKTTLAHLIGRIPGVFDGAMLRDLMPQLNRDMRTIYRAYGVTDDPELAAQLTYTIVNASVGYATRILTDEEIVLDARHLAGEFEALVLGYVHFKVR